MKPIAVTSYASVCLTRSLVGMVWDKDVFFAITFQFCLRVCHFERSYKPQLLDIKWYTSAFVLFWWF